MAALDSLGGTGPAGTLNTMPAEGRRASVLGQAPFYVTEFCTPAESIAQYGKDTVVLLAPPPAPAATRPSDFGSARMATETLTHSPVVETSFLFGRLTWAAVPLTRADPGRNLRRRGSSAASRSSRR